MTAKNDDCSNPERPARPVVIPFPSAAERELRRQRTHRGREPVALSVQPFRYARGVWPAPYRVEGCDVLIAINAAGGRVAEIVLRAGVNAVVTTAALNAYLAAADPPPSVQVAL